MWVKAGAGRQYCSTCCCRRTAHCVAWRPAVRRFATPAAQGCHGWLKPAPCAGCRCLPLPAPCAVPASETGLRGTTASARCSIATPPGSWCGGSSSAGTWPAAPCSPANWCGPSAAARANHPRPSCPFHCMERATSRARSTRPNYWPGHWRRTWAFHLKPDCSAAGGAPAHNRAWTPSPGEGTPGGRSAAGRADGFEDGQEAADGRTMRTWRW